MVTFHLFALHQSLIEPRLYTFWYEAEGKRHVETNRNGLQLTCLRIAIVIQDQGIDQYKLILHGDIKEYTEEYEGYVQKLV